MTIDEANKLKKIQLEVMDEIDRICRKNNICYYIVGGTLIGAIRHKGFIPWDIDMDIAMPRKEYNLFKEACLRQLNIKYQYCDYTSLRNYDKPHAIVRVKNTRLISKTDKMNREKADFGIFIDIFPLDNVPDDNKERKQHIREIYKLKKLRYFRIPYYTSSSRIKRMVRRMIKIMLSWISIYKLNHKMELCMKKYDSISTKKMCNMAGRYSYEKEALENEVFGKPIEVEFEGRKYYAPELYDRYLRHIYGDYMKLPPIDEQIGYLNAYESIDFGNS